MFTLSKIWGSKIDCVTRDVEESAGFAPKNLYKIDSGSPLQWFSHFFFFGGKIDILNLSP